MFTGIIETVAVVNKVEVEGTNIHFTVQSELAGTLSIDQSVAHNGVCLTVIGQTDNSYRVTAVAETLEKSNLKDLRPGSMVNLERCMPANGRFDGHIVQGHVDQTGIFTGSIDRDGSWVFNFEFDPEPGNVVVEKGSICINGVSLTCFNVTKNSFSVVIIPYTHENTNFGELIAGDVVNLEFDVIGKYVKTLLHRYQ